MRTFQEDRRNRITYKFRDKSEKDFLFKSPKDKVMGVACTKALEIKRRGLKTKVILEVNSVVCAN